MNRAQLLKAHGGEHVRRSVLGPSGCLPSRAAGIPGNKTGKRGRDLHQTAMSNHQKRNKA